MVIGVEGDEARGAEEVGEGVSAESAGLAAGDACGVAITAAVMAGEGAVAGEDGH